MDRDIAPSVRRRRIVKRAIAVIIAIAALTFSFAATVQFLRPSVRRGDLQFARVGRGSIDAMLQGSGTIVPAREQIIPSPVEASVLRIARRAGDRVRAGDELVALDTSATRLDVDRLAGSLLTKQSEQAQLALRIEENIANIRAQIEQKKLDAEIFRFKAEQNEKLYAAGLASLQENLAAKTTAKKCDIELRQLAEALDRARRTGQAQIAAAASELVTLRKERDQSQRQLDLAMMRADRDGVITSIVEDAGATLHRGDIVARIADLSSYRVDGLISDLHASRLSVGMPVQVRLDEAASVGGSISSIEPRIVSGSVKFHVSLDEPSNPRLHNNARVDVYPVTSRRAGTLRLRRGALGQGEREDVYVVRDGWLMRVPVTWGVAGQDFIEPLTGLREGDEVVITNMNDYAGVKALRLK